MAKKETKRRSTKEAASDGGSGVRIRKGTRLQKRSKAKSDARSRAKLPNSFKLTWQALKTVGRHWRPLGGILLVYLILNIIFASGLSSLSQDISSIKNSLDSSGQSQLIGAIGSFGVLIGSAGTSGSQTGSALQSVLVVMESLVIIWALRHLIAGQSIRVKMAYYNSMYPLVPFLLIVFLIIIQLLPIIVGGALLGLVLSSLVVSPAWLTAIFVTLFILLAAWSLYMLSSSVFALYIVTLPDMQPRRALRSARELVRFRRLAIIRRALFLLLFIFVAMGVIIIPLIIFATPAAAPVFYLLGMLALLFIHTYFYRLYRSML